MRAGVALRSSPGARLDIGLVGAVARRALAAPRRGRLAAVFERSVYLELSGDWVCVGAPGLGAGPLNALVSFQNANLWPAQTLAVGDPIDVGSGTVRVGSGLELAFGDAGSWTPPALPDWSDADLERGLAALDVWLEAAPPGEGLGALAHARPARLPMNPVLRQALPPIAALRAWLGDARAHAGAHEPLTGSTIARLIGLGPGLTPSGDDFLGGMMIALHLLGRAYLARDLAAAALPLARRDSNPISAAHLAAAAEGQGHERLHAALGYLVAGDAGLASALVRLAALGHCSGLDGLAGAATVLRCR